MTQTNNEREAFAIADKVIKEAYQDFNNKGNGWWGDERIPNYGILRGAIAKAICEEQSKISQKEQQEAVAYMVDARTEQGLFFDKESAEIMAEITCNEVKPLYTSPHKQAIPNIQECVNRFLGWRLPKDFAPDCGIEFDENRYQNHKCEPIGTNLFTADQAKAMFEYVFNATPTNTEVGE